MPYVELPVPADVLTDRAGNLQSKASVTVKIGDTATDVTHAKKDGTSPTTDALLVRSDGSIGTGTEIRYFPTGDELKVTISGRSRYVNPVSSAALADVSVFADRVTDVEDSVGDAAKLSVANTFAKPQVVENETAFISRQTLGTPHEYTTPAGTAIFEIDTAGNVTFGPNELLNKTPGVNYVVADGYYATLTRRLTLRSLILNEVGDPVDLRLGRISSPQIFAAGGTVTVTAAVPFDLIVAHADSAFSQTNGQLEIAGLDVEYASRTLAASTSTTGDQTVSRDTPGVLNVLDATPTNPGDLLTGGTRLARCGQETIQYTGISANQLTGVTLYPGDARSSVTIPGSSAVSQWKLVSCVSGTSGSIGTGALGEQVVYPVPQNGAHMAGVRPAESLGQLAFRALRNPDGAPASTASGEDINVGFGGETSSITSFTVEPPRLTASGGNLLLQTTPIGSIEAIPRMEILHDGSIRCGPISMLGNNFIKTPNPAALFIQNTDVAKNVLRLKMVAAQATRAVQIHDSADVLLYQIGSTGKVKSFNSATPAEYCERGADANGGYLDATAAAISNVRMSAGSQTGVAVRFTAAGSILAVGLYGVAPVPRAAAITSPTAPSAGYVQAEAAAMKTAVDALRVAVQGIGITA